MIEGDFDEMRAIEITSAVIIGIIVGAIALVLLVAICMLIGKKCINRKKTKDKVNKDPKKKHTKYLSFSFRNSKTKRFSKQRTRAYLASDKS